MVVPALPEKRFATKLLSLPDFVAQRCAALDAFCKRVAGHPALRSSPLFAAFLEAGEEAWAALQARPPAGLTLAKQRAEGSGLAGAARGAVAALTGGRPAEADAEQQRLRAYFTDLEARLGEAAAASERLVRRQGKLGGALTDFGAGLAQLAAVQPPAAAASLASLGECCSSLGARQAGQSASLKAALEEPMKDLVRSLQGVTGALASRAGAHEEHAALSAELAARRAKIDKLKAGGGDALRIGVEEREAASVALRCDQAREEFHVVCERMAGELLRANADRAAAIASVAKRLGEAQKALSEDTATAFRLMGIVGPDT